MMNLKTISAAVLALAISTSAMAADTVYVWRNGSSNTYSDIPKNLRMDHANKMNVRTHNVRQATEVRHKEPESLAERRLALAQEAAERDKKLEDENKRIMETNAKIKQENCAQARSNLSLAQNARNRDQLVPKYTQDVSKYCN
ncbi:hypothetical protein [Alysiella crassa]|uniref:DUF4124 domain-containing protein n=1 Tax=Alysiella crassa TaxID=153491 RepID=A0A376BL78_9NEIS|nr:hypothetical protein [Alysiella crassa]SSY70461.1 Uncharacterised protein [Alysiella crassa]